MFRCILILVLGTSSWLQAADEVKPSSVHFDPVVQTIEGFKVHVDPALLAGPHQAEGGRALRMLADHLHRISLLIPGERLVEVRTLEIWIEREHELKSMQYHPGRKWLVDRGYDPRLTKKVHIPRAAALVSRRQIVKHPLVVLHELAHAYHDQYLDFDNPRIVKLYEQAKQSKSYDEVLLYTGRKTKHYGLTNQMEYFAEGTEAYFGRNDFYPFVRSELHEHDPEFFELLVEIWGPLD